MTAPGQRTGARPRHRQQRRADRTELHLRRGLPRLVRAMGSTPSWPAGPTSG